MPEINSERLKKYFTDLVKISSPSWKEHEVLLYIEKVLKKLKVDFTKYTCGESYNLVARIKGNTPGVPILFSSHLDTVQPCDNIKPVITETKITSDGTTILGADDKSAVSAFLEAITCIVEKRVSHSPLEFIFTCAEEVGLYGIKGFDLSKLKSKYGFVFDSGGEIGKVVLKAPYQISLEMFIKGKAAHAGLAPEKGISAIVTAAEIISKIPHGRIDEETTVNVGLISGGKATNIVAEDTAFSVEARSINKNKLKLIENKIESIAKSAAKKRNAGIKINKKLEYPGYSISTNDKIIALIDKALKKIKIIPSYEASGGGSDTNIINKSKIKAVNLASGMREVHTKNEYITIKDLNNCAKLVLSIIESARDGVS